MIFEPHAAAEIELADPAADFAPASMAALAAGANRLLVGDEVIQFASAEVIAPGRWRLVGLLRGRGGTEPAASAGHRDGTVAVLLDESLVALDRAVVPAETASTFAGIGRGDGEPAYAVLANPGLGTRPPCPVHPRLAAQADGGIALAWTRRARGGWTWSDEVDVPLVEETEAYRVGVGPVEVPLVEWTVGEPRIAIGGADLAALVASHPGAAIWVRQIGRFGQSLPLLLHRLG